MPLRITKGGRVNRQFRIRAITSLSELTKLEPEWFQLWKHCTQLTTFQSPDWLIPWVEAFAPSRLWVLEARREGVLVGLAPLFIYGTGGDRIVAPLGAGVSDYLDVLIDPEVPEALEAISQFLRKHASEWTDLRFPDLPANSPLLHGDIFSHDRQYFDRQVSTCEFCPQLKLPASIDELRSVVPAKQLRNLRAARRQVNDAQVQLATQTTLDEFLSALFRLHEKRWQLDGEAGVLSDARVRELYRRAAPRLLERGVLRLFGLRHEGELIACLMAYFEPDVARLYMQGYDPEWARASPGAQLIGAALEEAVREKKVAIDFLRGRERYKYYWGSRDVPTFQLRIVPRRQMETQITEKSAA
jgi:CelD/BcsL family acetyltransferase involved in cellulose biosynthesis